MVNNWIGGVGGIFTPGIFKTGSGAFIAVPQLCGSVCSSGVPQFVVALVAIRSLVNLRDCAFRCIITLRKWVQLVSSLSLLFSLSFSVSKEEEEKTESPIKFHLASVHHFTT